MLLMASILYKLEWHYKAEKHCETQINEGEWQPNLGLNGPEYDYYNLLILRKNKEAKLFYVLTSMEKEEIATKINEYWEYSTSVGYDFDD